MQRQQQQAAERLLSAAVQGLRRLHAGSACQLHGPDGVTRSAGKVYGVAPADTGKPVSSGPYLSWLPGGRNHLLQQPLTQPLPDVRGPHAYKAPTSPPPTEITQLPNGARIISEASPGPTASIGIYVNSGSIYESAQNSGCSALLECLAFKSTRHRTSMDIIQQAERVGSTMAAMASREQMSYTMDCLKTSLPATLELLCDSVLNPAFYLHEVEEQKARLGMLVNNSAVALTLLNEKLVRHAFKGALAKPLIPDPESLMTLTPEHLRSFCATNYSGPHLILAAAGIDHKELVELAAPMLSTAPSGTAPEEPSSQYQAASVCVEAQAPTTNLIVGWEYKGGWRDVPGAVAMTVLTYLMGGGDSFSSGGPGKGMHSRLYLRVLNQYGWVHSCSAFNATFNTSGLVGVQAACDPKRANDMLDVMCREMELATRSLSPAEVERAKRTALATIYNALESKATSAEDIGRQFLTYGHRISGREYAAMIEAVTPHDINKFVSRLLDSKPSLATYGENASAVSYDNLLKRYGFASSTQQGSTGWQQASAWHAPEEAIKKVLSFGWRS